MHLRAKRYLRLKEMFFYMPSCDPNFKKIEMKESFFKKYISIYPTHLDFEERLYVDDDDASELLYFFSIPSKKKHFEIYDCVDLENIL